MLTLRIEGDSHPKTVKLVTDDQQAENAAVADLLDSIDAEPDFRKWFDDATAEQLAEGVEIPPAIVGEFTELLEADWPDTADQMDALRRDYEEQIAS